MVILDCIKSDYSGAFISPLIHFVIILGLSSVLFARLFLCAFLRSKKTECLLISFITFLFIIISFIFYKPMVQTFRFCAYLPFEEGSALAGQGTVNNVIKSDYNLKFRKKGCDEISRAYWISVNGNEFYCLDGNRLSSGDNISFRYYPKSKVVVYCQRLEDLTHIVDDEYFICDYNTLTLQKMTEWQLYLLFILSSLVIGLILAIATKQTSMPVDAVWLKGEMFYQSGFFLGLFLFLGFAISVNTGTPIPPWITFSLFGLFCVVQQIPVVYTLEKDTITKYVAGTVRIWEWSAVETHRITLFQTSIGSLFIIESGDANIYQNTNFFSFFLYLLNNRRIVALLPFKPKQVDYALSVLQSWFDIRIIHKWQVTSVFPLIPKKE